MGDLSVTPWKRYGKSRLYVNGPDGVRVGWRDLVSGESVVERPELRAEFDVALAEWAAREDQSLAATAVVSPEAAAAEASEAEAETPEAEMAPPPPAERPLAEAVPPPGTPLPDPPPETGVPEREWYDLSRNDAGAGPRSQAVTHRDAAPVRTLLARILQVHTDERAWRVGAVGEQKVAAQLDKLRPPWRVLHGIPVGQRGADIDHLVIGPAGVFSLNAKRHIDAKLWIGGGTFLVNGHRQPYIPKSAREAARASDVLSRGCGFPVPVRGVVVPVDAGEIVIKSQPTDVHVVNRMALRKWLESLPTVMEQSTVEAVYEVARRSTTWG
jgi:hypothetical protein